MSRLRTIKPSFFLNEELAAVPAVGRLLFAGLWCIADRQGRLDDRPKRIKIEVLPYDDCDVEALLAALVDAGFIQRYAVDGKGYIQVVNFLRHQNPHIKEVASVIPPPDVAIPPVFTNESEEVCEPDSKTVLSVPSFVFGDLSCVLSLGSGEQEMGAAVAAPPAKEKRSDFDIGVLFDHYKARIQPLARTRPDSKIKARLKTWSVAEIVTAIDHFADSSWWMEHNGHQGADWFFRSDAQIERFVNLQERTNGSGYGNAGGGGASRAGPDLDLYRAREDANRKRAEAWEAERAAAGSATAREIGADGEPGLDREPPEPACAPVDRVGRGSEARGSASAGVPAAARSP